MCTGVIVITATIDAWEMAIAASASRARGAAPMTCMVWRIGGLVAPGTPAPPATTSGSGRSRTAVLIAASAKHSPPNSQGPV